MPELSPKMAEARRQAKWDYYTDKIIITLGAVVRTRGDMQSIWARNASALMSIRDQYEKGGL